MIKQLFQRLSLKKYLKQYSEQINTHHHKFNNKIASYFEIKRTIPSNNDTITLFKSGIDTFRRNRLIHKLIDYNHKVVKEDRRNKQEETDILMI